MSGTIDPQFFNFLGSPQKGFILNCFLIRSFLNQIENSKNLDLVISQVFDSQEAINVLKDNLADSFKVQFVFQKIAYPGLNYDGLFLKSSIALQKIQIFITGGFFVPFPNGIVLSSETDRSITRVSAYGEPLVDHLALVCLNCLSINTVDFRNRFIDTSCPCPFMFEFFDD